MVAKTVVIARYDEDIAWTNDLPNDVQFFIVQKGEHVPNIGRESYSYLWYIIEHYKHLQGLYFFLQGCPFDHIINLDLNDWTPRFVGVRKITEADGSPEHTGLLVGDFAKQADIHIQFPFEFTASAQFCVTAKQIKNHAFRYYKKWFKMHEKYHDAPWIMERLWEHILF
jgi:hypothetical protein